MNTPVIMDSARRGIFLVLLMLFMVLAPLANAADSDGDGIDDSVDDCRFAAGTSTLDRNGCPDADGDGTSDINDGWSAGNPNFQNEYTTSSNSEYNDIEYSPDGEFIVTASDDGFVRKWNASTHVKLLAVAIIWGVSWVAGKVVVQDFQPFTAGWVRYIIAVTCFLVFLKLSKQWITPNKDQWKIIIVIGFLSTFLYQAFFMFGMQWTAAGDASLMITFNPLFTAVLAIPFLGEKFDKRLSLGLFLALCGVGVLAWYSPNVDIPINERLLGDALIGLAALSWAFTTILMKKAMTGENALSPLHLTVWASAVGLLIQTPAVIWEFSQFGLPTDVSNDAWLWVIFLAIGSTVLSYVWFADGIKIIGAGRSALYVYLVPIFGILSGWLLLDEKLGFSLVVSFALIVGGVYIAQSKESS